MKGSGKGIAVVVVHIDVMHSWQNGTRCRDDVNVLCCRSHLVWLVLSVPSLHALLVILLLETCSSPLNVLHYTIYLTWQVHLSR